MKILYDKLITISDVYKYKKDASKMPKKLVFFNSIQDAEYGVSYYVGALKSFYLDNPDQPFMADDDNTYKMCISDRFVIGDGKPFKITDYIAKMVGDQVYVKPFVATSKRYFVSGYSYMCKKKENGDSDLTVKNLMFSVNEYDKGVFIGSKDYTPEEMLRGFSTDQNGRVFGKEDKKE